MHSRYHWKSSPCLFNYYWIVNLGWLWISVLCNIENMSKYNKVFSRLISHNINIMWLKFIMISIVLIYCCVFSTCLQKFLCYLRFSKRTAGIFAYPFSDSSIMEVMLFISRESNDTLSRLKFTSSNRANIIWLIVSSLEF